MPHQEHQPKPMPSGLSREDAFDWTYRAVAGHSACLYVFTRTGFGVRAFEMPGPMALLVMVLYLLLAPCPEMVVFLGAWFVAAILHRLAMLAGRFRGVDLHSLYDGWPWLVRLIVRPKPSEAVAKGICEPLLALLIGGLLYLYSVPLGVFVMAGVASLSIKGLIESRTDSAQVQAIKDQEWEMRARLARYRGHR